VAPSYGNCRLLLSSSLSSLRPRSGQALCSSSTLRGRRKTEDRRRRARLPDNRENHHYWGPYSTGALALTSAGRGGIISTWRFCFFRERFGESHGQRCYEYLFHRTEPCTTCETCKVPLQTSLWVAPTGGEAAFGAGPRRGSDGRRLGGFAPQPPGFIALQPPQPMLQSPCR
jgi:hypothetical protein